MKPFEDTLRRLLGENHIPFTDEMVAQCGQYFELVETANRTMNLTRITSETEAAGMHFFGAIQLLRFFNIPHGARVVDIGTGAGFPGIPLKIARPDISLTLIDSSGKKAAFVRDAAEHIGIDAIVIAGRAEELTHTSLRETFDLAVSRAVAALPMLAELCMPLVRPGGVFAAFKGEQVETELAQAKNAIVALGGGTPETYPADPGAIVIVRKIKPAPDHLPRRFSKIKSRPL